jgi:hypothetical protein
MRRKAFGAAKVEMHQQFNSRICVKVAEQGL